MPRLRFVSTVEGVNTIELEDPLITIGRGINNVVCIEDANISKHHALLIREDDTYKLIDLHSVNGTSVNGERITVSRLKEGDAVRIGYLDLTYEIAAPIVAPAPVVPRVTAPAAPSVIEARPTPVGAAPALGSRPRLGFGVSGKPANTAAATQIGPPSAPVAPPPPAPPVETPVPVAAATPAPAPAKEEKKVMIQLPEKKPILTSVPPAGAPAPSLGGPPKLRPTAHIEPPAPAPAPTPAPVAPAPEPVAPIAPPAPVAVASEPVAPVAPPPAPAPIKTLGGPRLRPTLAPAPAEPAPETPATESAAPDAEAETAPAPTEPATPATPSAEAAPTTGPKKLGASPSTGAPKFRLKRE